MIISRDDLPPGEPLAAKLPVLIGEKMTTDFVTHRIANYGREVEQCKQDHEMVKVLWQFEEVLHHGLFVYDSLCNFDVRMTEMALNLPGDEAQKLMDSIEHSFRSWLLSSCELLEGLAYFEQRYGDIENGQRFREAICHVTEMLTPDEEFFEDEKLVELRDRAMESGQRGECEEIQ